MRYSVLAVITAMIMAASASAYAHDGRGFSDAVSIDIVSERGSSFLTIPHRDSWQGETHVIKNYLEAIQGANYGIVIHNRTPDRIGVVIAVDGRNIISGKWSNLANTEAMYIIDSYGYGRYDGWRTTSDSVHQFYFTDVADSYAIRTFGDDTAMGVIAVAVYREKIQPHPFYEHKMRDSAPAPPPAKKGPGDQMDSFDNESAGTGFGDEEYSPTIRVAFKPERKPVQKTLIKYEWREVLCQKGILYCRWEPHNRLWDEDRYAPFPPGYSRY